MFKTALHPEIAISFYKCPKVTPWGFSQGVNNVRIHILDSVFCFNRCMFRCKLEVREPANPIKSRVLVKRFHSRDVLWGCFVMRTYVLITFETLYFIAFPRLACSHMFSNNPCSPSYNGRTTVVRLS